MLKFSTVLLGIALLAGCATNGANNADAKFATTGSFSVKDFALKVEQRHTPDIVYHSEQEIQAYVKDEVIRLMKADGIFSKDDGAHALDISVVYKRRFVGDAFPTSTDSLGYPFFDYDITVLEGDKEITTVSRDGLTISGGFAMNFQVVGGVLREKSDEIPFMQILAASIFEEIKNMKE